MAIRSPLSAVFFYAVVSSQCERVVEFFPALEEADRFIAKVRNDEPEHAALLRVTTFEHVISAN